MSWEPAWKQFVERLAVKGYESPYLDRLEERLHSLARTRSGMYALEQEILEEMAAALGRADDKLCLAMLQLELAEKELEAAAEEERGKRLEQFEQCRRSALMAKRDLVIHRESLGFRDQSRVDALYPIPPSRRGEAQD